MIKRLKFVKLAKNWYIQLVDYSGSVDDLMMVEGADILCEAFANGEDVLSIDVSTISFSNGERILDMVEVPDEFGALYRLRDSGLGVWLCKVALLIFDGSFPKSIYFKAV